MNELTSAVTGWLDEVAYVNPVPPECNAVLVGLFESDYGYQGYVRGTDRFDTDRDWACDMPMEFEPPYLDESGPLRSSQQDYQEQVVQVVSEILGTNAFLRAAPRVFVGFDDLELAQLK